MHSIDTSAMAALAAIRQRDVSVAELTSRFLARITEGNAAVGAVRHSLADTAMAAALAMDKRIEARGVVPPLAGLPVVVKENCDTADVACSAGLSFRGDHVPSTDSAITARLRAAGAIILGTAVTDPGAFSVRTPEVTHPADPTLTVGGSSGGSAAALAAGFCLGAIGTDTGGSIRVPSACCGTVGLKPTFGALPMTGIFPLVPSLDHVGPMGLSVADVRLLWLALADEAPRTPAKPKRVGYDPAWVEMADQPIRAAFARGVATLKQNGIAAVEVRLPDLDEVMAMHGQIFLTESAAYHCSNYGDHIGAYPELARGWFAAARDISVGTYVDACSKRVAMTRAVDGLLRQVDAILTPTLAVARPPKHGQTILVGGVERDYTMGIVRLMALFDQTGHPAVAFPMAGGSDPLSSSLQVVGPRRGEQAVLDIAAMLETGGHVAARPAT